LWLVKEYQISDGAETEEKYHPSMIKSKKVVFRPSADLKEMLNGSEKGRTILPKFVKPFRLFS
jgi:hypothetical protein